MSSESGRGAYDDPVQLSLASLADAADALSNAAATLAAAARATAEALAKQTSTSQETPESQGINLGRGSDDIHESVFGKKSADQRPDVVGDGGGGNDTGGAPEVQTRPLPATSGDQKRDVDRVVQPYRLLVDTEADVLLYVCALIGKRQRVICYMPCGPNPLKTYKQLLENVTETPVHILTSSTPSKKDLGYTYFLESGGSVLLVPESLLPKFELVGDNSWVIHVGWPASEVQYTSQRKNHNARNNILVACSGDQSLYPSGDSIVELTEPWPQGGASFRAAVSILRPLYEVMLSEISLEMKSRVYQDWIQFHGIHGPRHVKTWTTSIMVQRANDYILGAFQWSGPHTGDIPLPEVSAGFVAQNGLQAAVQEGVLRVEDDDSDRPEPSPSPVPRPDSEVTQTEFQATTGFTYFAIGEEFDAIPLMCYIANKYDKVICFLDGQGALRYYQRLFSKITGRPVLFPTILSNTQATEEAVVQFLSAPPPAILLLVCNVTNLPKILSEGSVDCCIYWGFNVPLRHAKKNWTLINSSTTIIIMTATQRRGLPISSDIKKHPSAAIPLDLTESSTLTPMRNKTKSALLADKGAVRELYTNRVYGVGAIPRTSLSAEDAARRANQYAARVLLHGELEDGSETFPPIAARPPVPRLAVEKFNLQPAVDAGLMTVLG